MSLPSDEMVPTPHGSDHFGDTWHASIGGKHSMPKVCMWVLTAILALIGGKGIYTRDVDGV
ncbi:hypothetical protein HanPI659440_Chr10g0383271 [Helianthus annuus]|nr:hypothetical protein HanPI659440_Chr10g0383271 [Helianthus annuus]